MSPKAESASARLACPLSVLVVDDEEAHAEGVAEALERVGCACSVVFSGEEALKQLALGAFDVVITDVRMGAVGGLDVVERARRALPDAEVIVLTAYGTFEMAFEAFQRGADQCMSKPFNLEDLRNRIGRVARRKAVAHEKEVLQRQLDDRYGFREILGNSAAMHQVLETLRQVSGTDATVLIQGESGTGKELAARAIHANSRRSGRHFVALNCAALSEGILESELFGHEKGAFTGADAPREGRLEYAHGGTLFLDEVGDMPASTQIKLLRVIEEREITRVGSNRPIAVDVRLVTATNRDLAQLVEQKAFREDLYYRLNVVRVDMPPLRERREDIPLLIDAFLREFAGRHGKAVQAITPEARRVLECYGWPGNVRELRNCIESMVVIGRSGVLDIHDIPTTIRSVEPAPSGGLDQLTGRSLEDVERELIRRTLAETGGNREAAARILGIGERTLYRKLDKYGLR